MESESPLDRAKKLSETQISKARWALGLNGLLAVVLAVVILVWPSISLYALVLVFGAFSLGTGIVNLGASFKAPKDERGWLVFSSLLGIAVGVMVLVWPNISALALLYVIGAYAIAFGILGIYGAFRLPIDGSDTALMIFGGLVSIAFGVVMFMKPGDGALVTLALISAFLLVTGISQLVLAIGGKQLVERKVKRTFTPKAQHSAT